MDTDRFVQNLIRQAEDNPALTLGAAAALLASMSKLVNAAAWKKEVNRRVKNDRRK
jgi:hypothetical protein